MDLSNLPNILSGVLIIVAVAAAAWGALNRETLKTVRESNKDLIERVGILEAKTLALEADNLRITGENDVLRTVVTGAETLAELSTAVHEVQTTLNSHHEAAQGWITSLDKHVIELVSVMKDKEV